MEPVISIRGIGKKYRLGQVRYSYTTLRDLIAERFRGDTSSRPVREEFWALRDVTFDVREGETIGIIGRNGAGKSTLLKILSQITEPTEGEAHLRGRVASLLEVGVGFHPELSGRENVYLNGAILGMTRAEITRKFDEIVEFAEVTGFLDTPVKRFSSGMYVKLAFSVAAHLEPDVLIIDEVLSVGDAAFQKKCLGKMDDIHNQGRTIIVVSHNMSTVSELCERVVWFVSGEVAEIGPARNVVSKYLANGVESSVSWTPMRRIRDDFWYRSVEIVHPGTGESLDTFPGDSPIEIRFEFNVAKPMAPGRFAFRLTNDDGKTVLSSASADGTPYASHELALGQHEVRCTIPGNLLAPGQYYVSIARHPREDVYHLNVLSFTVSEQNSLVARDRRPGIIAPLLHWDRGRTFDDRRPS